MKFKLEKLSDDLLTVSVEDQGNIVIADFPRQKDEHGGSNAQNVHLLQSNTTDPLYLAKLMGAIGQWVVTNHSDKFYTNKLHPIIAELESILSERSLSMYEVAKKADISRSTMLRAFSGEGTIQLDKLTAILEVLGKELKIIDKKNK